MTMQTWALIDSSTNIVDNVVVLEEGSEWVPPADHYIENITGLEVGIGWTYDPATGQWSAPPLPPPPPSPTDTNGPVVL